MVDGWAERRSCYIQISEAWAITHRWIRKSLGREAIWGHERPEGEGHGGCFLYTLSASTPGSEGGVWHFCNTRTTEEGALPFSCGSEGLGSLTRLSPCQLYPFTRTSLWSFSAPQYLEIFWLHWRHGCYWHPVGRGYDTANILQYAGCPATKTESKC